MLSKDAKYSIAVQITGFLFFSFLFFLALIYFKERIFSVDPAFFLFKMIEFREHVIEFGRWGAVPSQLLPLWAIKNNFSLETVMKIYSVSFIIIFYLIFLISTVLLNNNKAGIAIMLGLCLWFRHAFYYSSTELYQGMAMALIVWALISPEKEYHSVKKKWAATIVSIILIYIISYYHQITLFLVLFVLIAEFLRSKPFSNIPLISALSFSIIWFFLRVFLLSNTNYEKEKIIDLKTLIEQLPHIFKLPGTIYLEQFFKDNILAFSIPIAIIFFLLIQRKNWFLLLFFFSYSIGFLVLVLITFYHGESPMVLENYFTVVGFFIAALLTLLLYEKIEKRWILIIVIPLLLINLKGVFDGHYILTKRIEYMQRIITHARNSEKRKFIIHHHNFPWQYAWVKWTFPFETAILSSLHSPDSTMTFFISDDMDKYNSFINEENILLGAEWNLRQFSSGSTNKNYFRLPPSGYEKLSSHQNDSAFDETNFDSTNINIIPVKQIYHSEADSFIVAEMLITNQSGKKIHSIPKEKNGVYLSYHIYDTEGNIVLWDGNRSNLEVDINSAYIQGLNVILPRQQGEYIVEVDFITEGLRWWGIKGRFKLFVD